jgi:uncharacterized membrane protein
MPAQPTPFPRHPGLVLGAGLAALTDGVVFHQLLQWHHMASDLDSAANFPGLRFNVTLDGALHAGALALILAGLALLWSARHRVRTPEVTRRFWGSIIVGFGGFNVIEGVIDHHILGLHHVNETVAPAEWPMWDYGFLAVSAGVLALGLWLGRTGHH